MSNATIDAPAEGSTSTPVEGYDTDMSGGQFCAVAVSCSADLAGTPVYQQPPEGPVPTVRALPNDPPLQQTFIDSFVFDAAIAFATGGASLLGKAAPIGLSAIKTGLVDVIDDTLGDTITGAGAAQAVEKFWDWASSSPKDVAPDTNDPPPDTSNQPDASIPDSSIGDKTGAQNPGQDGGTEIGVADPGEAGSGGGHYVAPLGPGPDGAADPGEDAGGGGGYVKPIGAGPDGPADPGETGGGGGVYVRPIGTGSPDGPAGPGDGGDGGGGGGAGGGGGGGGGGLEVGGGHGGGPVKEE